MAGGLILPDLFQSFQNIDVSCENPENMGKSLGRVIGNFDSRTRMETVVHFISNRAEVGMYIRSKYLTTVVEI